MLIALAKKFPSTHLVISGGAGDRKEALQAARDISATVIAGETTLQEMMNLIRHSRAVVSVDTGMAHITAQLGKSLIVMRTCVGRNWWLREQYGSNAPITVFSCDTVCSGGHISQNYPLCMSAITMGEVVKKL